jgi:hypothetical protein
MASDQVAVGREEGGPPIHVYMERDGVLATWRTGCQCEKEGDQVWGGC